jgi:hypothetical protein
MDRTATAFRLHLRKVDSILLACGLEVRLHLHGETVAWSARRFYRRSYQARVRRATSLVSPGLFRKAGVTMLRAFTAVVLGSLLLADAALAKPCPQPAAPANPPAPAAKAPAAQAQRPQSTRSYSYEPTMQTSGGMMRSRVRPNFNSFGLRSAGSKVMGNY